MFKAFFPAAALFVGSLAAHAQQIPNLLQDGNFDALPISTLPNCGAPAGAWHFVPGLCELAAGQFQVVATGTFATGAPGRSLMQDVPVGSLTGPPSTAESIFLRNMLAAPILPRPSHLVVLEFDLWVVDGFGGGSIWFGTQGARGPQMTWFSDGAMRAAQTGILVAPFPTSTWQHVRLVIDLGAQNYDIWWSSGGSPPALIASAVPFWNGEFVPHIDRLVFARFDDNPWGPHYFGPTRSYLDNVRAWEARDCNANRIPDNLECYANCDASTTPPVLNVEDFSCFINLFASAQSLPHEQQLAHCANCDASTAPPVLNVEDFSCFINAFAAGCP
jgi:hypothetical protein